MASKDSSGNSVTNYSWAYVNLPKAAAKLVTDFAGKIDDDDIYDEEGYGREDKPHITVLYGLHTNSAKKVRDVVEHEEPMEATIGGISVFEQDDYNVLKFDIKSKCLARVNKKLRDSSLEYTNSYPKYHPHMTIAYLKKDADYKKYTKAPGITGKDVKWDSLLFGDQNRKNTKIKLGVEEKKAMIEYYAEGFVAKCAEAGINPEALVKRSDTDNRLLAYLANTVPMGSTAYGAVNAPEGEALGRGVGTGLGAGAGMVGGGIAGGLLGLLAALGLTRGRAKGIRGPLSMLALQGGGLGGAMVGGGEATYRLGKPDAKDVPIGGMPYNEQSGGEIGTV